MPDWARRVSRLLGPLAIPPRRRDEIVREMAGFIEDRYEEQLKRGESPRAARRAALARAGRWPELAEAIEGLEGHMARRWRTLWLPGLTVSVLAQGVLFALGALGAEGKTLWHPPLPPILLFWPWLLTLPLLGAAGAEWSRLRGGSHFECLIVAVFPVLAPWILFFPLGAVRILSEDIATVEKLLILLVGSVNWVVVPALALAFGALPVLRHADRTARPA